MADTQALIDKHLSNELAAVMFHNQHDILELLRANDRDFKSRLSALVELGLWESCEDSVKSEAVGLDRTLSECKGEHTVRTRQ